MECRAVREMWYQGFGLRRLRRRGEEKGEGSREKDTVPDLHL